MTEHERSPSDLLDEYEEPKRPGCVCGWPDLPGQCPGPKYCPMAYVNYQET